MTTGSIDGISYVLPRGGAEYYTAIQEFVAAQLSNDPRTYENFSIGIYNATGEPGKAAAEKERLEEAGYKVSVIDNTTAGTYDKEYTLYYTNTTSPGTKRMLEKFYDIDFIHGKEMPEGLPKTCTYVIVLGPSPAEEATDETPSE